MKLFQKASDVVLRASVGLALAGASVAAFAQSTGTGTSQAFSDTAIVASINSVGSDLIDVGGAVLGIVTVAWGFKVVKGFLGR